MKFELVEPFGEDAPVLPPESGTRPDRTVPPPPPPGYRPVRPVRARMAHTIGDVRSSLGLLRARVMEKSTAEAAAAPSTGVEGTAGAVFHADRFSSSLRKDR